MPQTAFKQPDMQDAGEECESCRTYWEYQGLPPMIVVNLAKSNGEQICTDGGIPIVVCPRCDGDWILRLPKE